MRNMKDRLKILIGNGSIKDTLIFYIFVIVLVNIIVTGAFSYYIFSNDIIDRIYESENQALKQSVRNMDFVLQGIENALRQSFDGKSIDIKVEQILSGDFRSKLQGYKELTADLRKFCRIKEEVDSIFLIKGTEIVASSEQTDYSNVFDAKAIIADLIEQSQGSLWTNIPKRDLATGSEDRICFAGQLQDSDNYIVLFLKSELFQPLFKQNQSNDISFIIFDSNNEKLNILNSISTSYLSKYTAIDNSKNSTVKINGTKYMVTMVASDYTGWHFYYQKPYNLLVPDITKLGKLIVIVSVICIFIFITIGSALSALLSRKVDILKTKVNNYLNSNDMNQYADRKRPQRMNILSKFNFNTKLFIILIIVVIIPIGVIEIFSYQEYKKIAVQKLEEQCFNIAEQRQNRLEKYLLDTRNSLNYFYHEENIREMFDVDNKNLTTFSKNAAAFIYAQNEKMLYMELYDKNRSLLYSSRLGKASKSPDDKFEILDSYGNDKAVYFITEKNSSSQYCIPLGKRISDINGFEMLGYVFVYLDESGISNICFDTVQDTSFAYITDLNGTILVHPNKNMIGKNEALLNSDQSLVGIENRSNFKSSMDNIVIEHKLNENWKVNNIFSTKSISDSLNTIIGYILQLTLINIFVLVIIIFYMTTKTSRPIKQLSRQTEEYLRTIGTTPEKKYHCNDEIEKLTLSFDDMMERIDVLIHEVYEEKIKSTEAELKKKETEYSLLQSQINPHFLYNTLNLLRWKAMMLTGSENDVTDIICTLSDFFRLSLSKGENLVSLGAELDHARKYMDIMKFRCDNLTTNFQVYEDIQNYKVPKIILQPILENAINHGILRVKRSGVINIAARAQDDMVIIDISDNGVGMEPQKLLALREVVASMEKGNTKGFGLRNVNQRIKYCFSSQYGITIDSIENEGTTVTVTIPQKLL